ncbi:RND family transporter [Candidatus Bipolaricaulota bacterium]|nr:RND family transporter [Candidatus Bipolaricaulota bacterium]
MNHLTIAVRKMPALIVGAVVLVTLIFGYAIKNLRVEADFTEAIPPDLPEMQYLDEVNEVFPRQEFVIVGLIADDIFTANRIGELDRLAREFENLSGVGQVISPTNVSLIRGSEESIEVSPILERLPVTPQEIERFRREITTNRLYENTFISPAGTAAIILVQIENDNERERILRDIRAIVSDSRSDGVSYRVAGEAATLAAVKELITNDLVLLSPLVVFVILLILFASFRSVRGVVLPILTVVIATIWTLGIMSIAGVPLSIMTTVVPTILIAVGSAYGIHIINRFNLDMRERPEKDWAISNTIRHTGIAVLMAGLTTMAGFLSFSSSRIQVIREFGLFTAIGVVCSLLFALTFVPAILSLAPVARKPGKTDRAKAGDLLVKPLIGLGTVTTSKSRIFLVAAALLVAASAVGIANIRVESDLVQMFGKKTQIMQDNEFFNRHFSGTMTLQIIIEADRPDAIKEPAVLHRIEQIQAYVDQFELVGNSQSIVDVIKEMNRVMNAEQESFYTIPDSKNLVSQYLLLYSLTGDERVLENLVSYDYSTANLTVFLKSGNLTALRSLENAIDEYIAGNIDMGDINVNMTGRVSTLTVLSELIVQSQLLSIGISLVLVFLITSLIFRSGLLGVICTMPIVVTIAVSFGLMGWLDVPLDLATVLIASIAVGIGIDYSIHYVNHYRTARKNGMTPEAAVIQTNTMAGRAIIYNALAVGAGFLVLILSNLASIGVLGAMIALTMFVSSLGALILIPAILSSFERRAFFRKRLLRHANGVPADNKRILKGE